MAEKKTPPPIDRPLSKAYLREFMGWSTAYPPGLSDPTSVRTMENILITREGGARVRPALRSVLPEDFWLPYNYGAEMVGGWEHFFLNDGRKALLFAVRQGNEVGFRVAVYNSAEKCYDIEPLTAPGIDFNIPQGESELNFTNATTFVKYLQIDNKILALSDGGEDLRLFNVGANKSARKVTPIAEPLWAEDRALTVVHPDAAWINEPVKDTIPTAETPNEETLIRTPKKIVGTMTTASGQPFTLNSHGLSVGEKVVFYCTTAPTTSAGGSLTNGGTYYVKTVPSINTFTLAAAYDGTTINPSSAGAGLGIAPANSGNEYNFGFFYTFENEIGESAASQPRIIRASRGWSQWQFFSPTPEGNKSGNSVTDPKMAMDQLVAIMPQSVFEAAIEQAAIKWNLYMFTWSDQDAAPNEAVLVASRELSPDSVLDYDKLGWAQVTAAIDLTSTTTMLPTEENRYNYSDPSSASQGLVAGDRLILVNDRKNGAVIRWTSNLTGEYTNFTPSKGGGMKTLTSGNLMIPVNVKLWQNPQSVDTITILCSGVDGYSTSFYMAPATVDGQSNSTLVMGFEETTATPGTVSPYGVEVLNNALYHPLDTELMKSTANNYNINHATMSEDIANKWVELLNKQNIISSQHDTRLYYLVHNPEGEPLIEGCKGNEIWVYDAAKDTGRWSRWLVQGIALSKLEVGGKLYLGLARPEGIFIFDEFKLTDDVATQSGTLQRGIQWKLETNTQGANRAHDAWAHLQQANVTIGNFRGSMKYGIRGRDSKGFPVEVSKVVHHPVDSGYQDEVGLAAREMPFDFSDYMRIGRQMKEWYFFAESIVENSEVVPSYGQLNYVQYTFTPVSVNVGYAEGSVETFEYGRDTQRAASSVTYNGVTLPFADNTRP